MLSSRRSNWRRRSTGVGGRRRAGRNHPRMAGGQDGDRVGAAGRVVPWKNLFSNQEQGMAINSITRFLALITLTLGIFGGCRGANKTPLAKWPASPQRYPLAQGKADTLPGRRSPKVRPVPPTAPESANAGLFGASRFKYDGQVKRHTGRLCQATRRSLIPGQLLRLHSPSVHHPAVQTVAVPNSRKTSRSIALFNVRTVQFRRLNYGAT